MKKRVFTGTVWEDKVSYCRAIKVGNLIEVSGTTAVSDGVVVGATASEQASFIFKKIELALIELGASREDVIRTRMYVTNIKDWEEVGKVHGAFFKGINPASTLLEVSGLIDDWLLVEIEATAYIE